METPCWDVTIDVAFDEDDPRRPFSFTRTIQAEEEDLEDVIDELLEELIEDNRYTYSFINKPVEAQPFDLDRIMGVANSTHYKGSYKLKEQLDGSFAVEEIEDLHTGLDEDTEIEFV